MKSLNLYDPVASENAQEQLKEYKNLTFKTEKFSTLIGSDGLIICTEWKEFWDPDPAEFKVMNKKYIFDGRNILNKSRIQEEGITYIGVGL